ncbi:MULTISPECIES: kynureninase [unclassified Fusibacter]|uniref:kynureninase n=1 Tax=unclassified Fusibacter TaxID=2624464 RepID=UPI00101116B4|nr:MULTISPECIES: kynureninase [unclassified Fusibacter]MCK8058451.1 kynureninase [Fusibacter sp. A2]NPE22781.1 kynureninase [Fusibacter sp. A1]RXV60337.1 kynureninase [Fusibacter sp. A1]
MNFDMHKMAQQHDDADSLKKLRNRFYTLEQSIYMDGNSLGLSGIDSKEFVLKALDDWQKHGIKIWGIEGGKYYNYPRYLGNKMSALIGADPEEVIVLGSITTNIHQALATLYKPTKKRYKIVVDALNFPTDIYAVTSILKLKGIKPEDALVTVPSEDGTTLDTEMILSYLKEDVALVLLPAVLYRSAQILDIEVITNYAHQQGIIIGWDLAHGIGAVEFDFNAVKPDFAVWCTYKYLNAGPGSAAGLYLNRRHFTKTAGLAGWFGNRSETQFALKQQIEQANDAGGLLQGTPHILSMAALEGSLVPFEMAGVKALREKSIKMTEFLIACIDQQLASLGFSVGSPRDFHKRGGHVALVHEEAYRISLALRDLNVIPDYREPNVIRLAPMALYNTFTEIVSVIDTLKLIMTDKVFERYTTERETVL